MSWLKVFGAAGAFSLLASAAWSQATLTNTFTGVNRVIPDGQNTGVSDTRTLSFTNQDFGFITNLEVLLTISNGYNGDFYGYLVHESGFAVLLNRSGRTLSSSAGYGDAGMNVLLTANDNDVHRYQSFPYNVNGNGQLSGQWGADGRNVDPAHVEDTDLRNASLSSFYGTNPDGQWTLFLADMDSGAQGTLVQWGLIITAIPEPSPFILAGFGALLLIHSLRRHR